MGTTLVLQRPPLYSDWYCRVGGEDAKAVAFPGCGKNTLLPFDSAAARACFGVYVVGFVTGAEACGVKTSVAQVFVAEGDFVSALELERGGETGMCGESSVIFRFCRRPRAPVWHMESVSVTGVVVGEIGIECFLDRQALSQIVGSVPPEAKEMAESMLLLGLRHAVYLLGGRKPPKMPAVTVEFCRSSPRLLQHRRNPIC
jgi:hypothetical protein